MEPTATHPAASANAAARRNTALALSEAATITVEHWSDPVVDAVGFDVNGPYTERYWLPIVGPSATWALRRLAQDPDGTVRNITELGCELGLWGGHGANAPIVKTLARLVHFGLARFDGTTLWVRHHVAPLTLAQRRRLPASLSEELQVVSRRSAGMPSARPTRAGRVAS